jgi:hypothetical protein
MSLFRQLLLMHDKILLTGRKLLKRLIPQSNCARMLIKKKLKFII